MAMQKIIRLNNNNNNNSREERNVNYFVVESFDFFVFPAQKEIRKPLLSKMTRPKLQFLFRSKQK